MTSPSPAVLELLPLHAMGALDDDEAAVVEQTLAEHPALRKEVDRWREALTAMGAGELPVPPDPRVRVRLLASMGAPGAAIGRFAAEVAEMFDISIDAAREVLARADEPKAWLPLLPGIDRISVATTGKYARVECTLVRMAPGTRFPRHRHTGEEVSLVMHGGAHISDGRDLRPGDVMVADVQDEHDLYIEGGDVCIFAVRTVGIVPVFNPAG